MEKTFLADNFDIKLLSFDLLPLFCLMETTIREEIIIAKHDIQHLNFICENLSDQKPKSITSTEIPDFNRLKGISKNLESLSEKMKNKFSDETKYLFQNLLNNGSAEKAKYVTYKFNKLRIAFMKSLSMISKELDYLHKTIAESCYSLPPMIDPVRRYKRKIDKDELTVLSEILKSYRDKLEGILQIVSNSTYESKYSDPLIYIDYSASTKLFENPEKKIYEILDLETLLDSRSQDQEKNTQGFIRLPYWAVKMTEYTSGIAHELVHLYLHLLDVGNPNDFAENNTNSATSIMREYLNQLEKEINEIVGSHTPERPDLIAPGSKLSEEIVADLFSIFVAGPSYYFSLFVQGTARYVEEVGITRSVSFMYARILFLEKIIERILENDGLLFNEEVVNSVEKLERLLILLSGDKDKQNVKNIVVEELNKLSKGVKYGLSRIPRNKKEKNGALKLILSKIDNLIEISHKVKQTDKEFEKELFRFLDKDFESNKFYILSKMLISSRKYIDYIIDQVKIFASEGVKVNDESDIDNDTTLYNLLYGKYLVQDEIADRVVELTENILLKSSKEHIETLSEILIREISKSKNYSKMDEMMEKYEYMNEFEPAYESYVLKNANLNAGVRIMRDKNDKEIFDRVGRVLEKLLNKSDLPIDIMPQEVIRFNLESSKIDERMANRNQFTFDYSVIPEYLWEMSLKYFSLSVWERKKKVINSNLLQESKSPFSETVGHKDEASDYVYCPKERLLKLTVSRLLGVDARREILLKKEGLKLDSVKEWLFAKVDWRKSAMAYTNRESKTAEHNLGEENIVEIIGKDISKTIENIVSNGKETANIGNGKSNTAKNLKYANFILGDYDFLIKLPNASTRKDIDWPPVKRDKKGNLLTYYSYREYIVEKIVLDNKESVSKSTRKEASNQKNRKESYLLQFVRFKESFFNNNNPNDPLEVYYDIIVSLLHEGYEVYLSNSWNEIFIKYEINEENDNDIEKLISKYKKVVKNTINSNKDESTQENLNEIIGDVQSYFVFRNLSVSDIRVPAKGVNSVKMRTILKTRGVVEKISENKGKTDLSFLEKCIKTHFMQIEKINFTLGIMDYVIDWKEVDSLQKAKSLAVGLISSLANCREENAFDSFSTLTSIIESSKSPQEK